MRDKVAGYCHACNCAFADEERSELTLRSSFFIAMSLGRGARLVDSANAQQMQGSARSEGWHCLLFQPRMPRRYKAGAHAR